jgi:two-component system nitrate/nitrite response regulator NarL
MATSPAPGHLRVLVASEQALIAEAVRTALASRGHEALVVRWPGGPRPPAQRRPPTHGETQVGLLLSDLDRWSRIRAATLIVERISIPWMALTTSPRGPAWGGLLAAGARIVLPSTTRLDRITELLNQAARGEISMPVSERRELEDAWQEMRTRHDTAAERLSRLTPREREVLSLMYAGSSVARIAEMLEVAPATVRSQVKSVLRKLDVNTQLAAVAAFDDVLDVFNGRTAHHLPKPRPPAPPETAPVERR